MKYDKPVWQIMHACADAMAESFRYEDVSDWFKLKYPDVSEATIRAHLVGLTENGRAKHVQFAQRSPVFRRVARGEYAPIPIAERGEDPDADGPSASNLKMGPDYRAGRPEPLERKSPKKPNKSKKAKHAKKLKQAEALADDSSEVEEPHVADIILLGSVGDRVNVPAPAKEVFREVSFQLSRLEAELSGSEWFVLSAEHGLLAPNEWMSPDSRTLADMDPAYRVSWAGWVVARLESLVGSLEGLFVSVGAPNEFIGPLFADLQDAGAVVSSGQVGLTVQPPAARTADQPHFEVKGAEIDHPDVLDVTARLVEGATVVPIDPDSPAGLHLADQRHAVPASELTSLPNSPGLYGWFVDPIGARELNRSLMLPVRSGLIFVGQVGGSSWQSLADPVLNLRDHVERIQLHGRARASTFRMTLATVLRDHLHMTSLEDPKLTAWMLEHLSVATWAHDNFGELRELEQAVIGELDPPLNVDHLPASEYRARLTQMRSALA
ncbi:DUF6884 domain-containing protein [Aeromicrobium sp.]|uniref:DUF7669 domain-containing protein n=1 Tax=Aeromicrobium sp. TaxID=1871063 RepID=UPI0030BAF40A